MEARWDEFRHFHGSVNTVSELPLAFIKMKYVITFKSASIPAAVLTGERLIPYRQ